MRIRPLLLLFFFFQATAYAEPAYITFPADVDWVTRSSDHFDVLFRRGQDTFAQRTLVAAENAFRLLTPIFPESPPRTWIVLADFVDSENGYSIDLPYPHMVIFAAPPDSAGQLADLDDWLSSIVLHEYVHTLHLYPAHGLWKLFRIIFGTTIEPNALMPSHLHEGIAVLLETEKTLGGRGRGTHFSMYRRMAVNAKVWGTDEFTTLDRLDGTTSRWPQGTSAYFFGYTLYKELWAKKGAKGIYDLTLSYSSNWPLLVSLPAKEVYGIGYADLWKDIFKKTTIEAQGEIDAIRRKPLSPLQYVTHSQFGKWDLVRSPDGNRVAYRSWRPSEGSTIELVDIKSSKVVRSLEQSAGSAQGMCWATIRQRGGIFFIEPSNQNGYSLNRLKWYEWDSEKQKTLRTKEKSLGHLHNLSCDPTGSRILVYQESGGEGFVREYRVDPDKTDAGLEELRHWKIPESSWVSSLLVGNPNWFTLRHGLSTSLYRWDLSSSTPTKVEEFRAHVFNLRPTSDLGRVLAIADFDERDEIWELDVRKHSRRKIVAVLGGVDAFDVDSNRFLVSSYEHGGYDIAEAKPVASAASNLPPAAPSTSRPPNEVAISSTKEYSAWGTLVPRTWIPTLLFVPNGVEIGAWVPGFDVSQKHVYNLFGGYDTRGLAFADFLYSYRFGNSFSLDVEPYLYPQSFSTTDFFQRWGASVGVGGYLGSFPPHIRLSALFSRVESSSQGPVNRSIGVGLDISHRMDFKRRPLSISTVRGTKLYVSHAQYFKAMGSDDNYFSTVAGIEQYLEAPWLREHVFYWAAKTGYTEGTAFYNSFFQAGGDLLFYQARSLFLNRGFPAGFFPGRRMFNFNLEYRFPLFRIERGIGQLPLFFKKMHTALVTDMTTMDYGMMNVNDNFTPLSQDLFRVFYMSAGIEFQMDCTFFYYLPTQIRVGAYHGFGRYGSDINVTVGLEAAL